MKRNIVLAAMISCLLFCALIITATLTPLSSMGNNANQFNGFGMWVSVGGILIMYLIPVVIYMFGLTWMKYVMAVLCSIGTLVFLSAFGIVMVIGWFNEMSDFTSVLVICGLGTTANIIWFILAFRSDKHHSIMEKPNSI